MSDKADFEQLTALAMRDTGRAHMRPVIQKELLSWRRRKKMCYSRG